MKLAEALSIRKDLQKRIQQLGQRIQNNVKVQEGDAPSEEPTELMKELDACLTQLEDLIWRINATNMQTTNAQGVTLTQLMARKDALGDQDGDRGRRESHRQEGGRMLRTAAPTRHGDPVAQLPDRAGLNHKASAFVGRTEPHYDRCPEPAAPVHDEHHGAGSARCHPNARLRPHGALPTG